MYGVYTCSRVCGYVGYCMVSCVCSCPNIVCRSQATLTPQQAPPTSHQSMSLQSSILAPVEVVLPLHISHVVLCEGFGTQALELVLSFLYTGSVDINEGSPYVRLWACAVATDRPSCTVYRGECSVCEHCWLCDLGCSRVVAITRPG